MLITYVAPFCVELVFYFLRWESPVEGFATPGRVLDTTKIIIIVNTDNSLGEPWTSPLADIGNSVPREDFEKKTEARENTEPNS